LNYIYLEYLGSCKKKLQKLQKLALIITTQEHRQKLTWGWDTEKPEDYLVKSGCD